MTYIHHPRRRQKLIQMNMWEGRLYYPLHKFLDEERPDFVTAQELVITPRRAGPAHTTPEDIIETGLMHTFVHTPGIAHGMAYGHDRRLGLGIFANDRLEKQQGMTLFPYEDIDQRPSLGYYHLLHATAEVGGKAVHLLTYHGRPQVDKNLWHQGRLGTTQTEGHFSAIAAYVCQLSGPTILAGDFNLWPDAPALAPLGERLTNLVTPQHMAEGRNAMAWKADEIVCHLFVSPEVKVETFEISRALVSDHQPLVMSFSL